MLRLAAAREGLDDHHASAAAGPRTRQHTRLIRLAGGLPLRTAAIRRRFCFLIKFKSVAAKSLQYYLYLFAPLKNETGRRLPMTTIASKRRSRFGMSCAHCDHELIAPEWSEYRNERQVHHVWRCWKCDCSFETIVDTNVTKEPMTRDDVFPSLLVA